MADRSAIHDVWRQNYAYYVYYGMALDYIPILDRLYSYANTASQRSALGYIAIANYLHLRLPVDLEVLDSHDRRVTHYAGPWNVARLRADAYRYADEQLGGAEDLDAHKALEVYRLTGVARDDQEARFLVNDPRAMEACAFREGWLFALGDLGDLWCRYRSTDGGEVALRLLAELPFEARKAGEDDGLEALAELPLGGCDVDTLDALMPDRLSDERARDAAAARLERGRDLPDVTVGEAAETPSCPICFCTYGLGPGSGLPFVLICGHDLCYHCALSCLKNDPRCPHCRRRLYHRVPLARRPGFSMVTMHGAKLQDVFWDDEELEPDHWNYYRPFGDVDQDEGEELHPDPEEWR
ncbi:E3 ubiquitin-protein ligase rnf4 [Diplodia intermedia]|uniref:E3 ubiquitin-protein ligase rnf4 n=1 Tax=Diplodia intermedia TaxID=856260 RepID=A0ABR3TE77_9PEZI